MEIRGIGALRGLDEIAESAPGKSKPAGAAFSEALKNAIQGVDGLQKESEISQAAFAEGKNVELHDVLIKVEEAEIAFRAMMEVRNKLVEAYREVMRMGG